MSKLAPGTDVISQRAPESVHLIDTASTELQASADFFRSSAPGLTHGDFSPANFPLKPDSRVGTVPDWEAVR